MKNQVRSIFNSILESSETKKKYDEYVDSLWSEQAEQISLFKENKVPVSAEAKNFAVSRLDDFHNRIFNSIIKEVKSIPVIETKKLMGSTNGYVDWDFGKTQKQSSRRSRAQRIQNVTKFLGNINKIMILIMSDTDDYIPTFEEEDEDGLERENQ